MLKDIAVLFLRLGTLGFGGPLATIAMMEEETVRKRNWFTPQVFSQNYALLKVFPGPTATQMSVRLGWLRGGVAGGVVAGLCFILPSFFLIIILGLLLGAIGESANKNSFVMGMQVAALVVILQGAMNLAKANYKKDFTILIALISFFMVLFKPNLEAPVLLTSGILGILLLRLRPALFRVKEVGIFLLIMICLKAALLTFGTGLAIVPLLEADVVEKYHWLTHSEFLQALALGQVTPGPVIITMSWIGFKLLGWSGAVMATLGIFLPGFLISLFALPFIEKKWGETVEMKVFYRFVIPAVVGAMFAVTGRLIFLNLRSSLALSLFTASGLLLVWKKVPPWFLIPVFGIFGIFIAKFIDFVAPYFF